MALPEKKTVMGMALGAVCATLISAIGPGITLPVFGSDGLSQPAFNPADLIKFKGQDYRVGYEEWVDTTPVSTAVIKKIEGGKVSYVTITTTSTGTYSSDAMTSSHVQYPGITVERATPVRAANHFSSWLNGSWMTFYSASAGSFQAFDLQ